MKDTLPKLTPITSTWMDNIIEDFNLQDALFNTYGSPLNIHSLPSFEDNINLLKDHHFSYILIERGARNKDHLDAFEN